MNKKILILSSSPRKGGNSDVLCDKFAEGAKEAGHIAEKIFLKDKDIHYCTGCGVCNMKHGHCSQKDDAADILEKMVQADVIVMATPVYFYTMDGQMKTMIDRTSPRYTDMNDKEFYFILTAADTNKKNLERTAEGFRGFTTCLNGAKEKGVIYATGVWHVGDIKSSKSLDEAFNMGKAV